MSLSLSASTCQPNDNDDNPLEDRLAFVSMSEVGRAYGETVQSAEAILEDGSILASAPRAAKSFHNILLRFKTWGYETKIETDPQVFENEQGHILQELNAISTAVIALRPLSEEK